MAKKAKKTKTPLTTGAKKRTVSKRKVAAKIKKRPAKAKKTALKVKTQSKGVALLAAAAATDGPTPQDILDEAEAAQAKFDGPIETLGSVEQPTQAQLDCLDRMQRKQTEIQKAATKQILATAALAEALKRLRSATKNLNDEAQKMVNVTAVLKQANKFLGFGTDAVNAIKSVTK